MQNRIKLTDAVVSRAALPEGKAEAVLWDTEIVGFGLRIRGSSRSWIVQYRPAGKGRTVNARRVKLGTPETIRTAAARKLALASLGKAAAGGDPAAERAEQKRRSGSRVADLLDRYEADLIQRNYVTRSQVMNTLRRRGRTALRSNARRRCCSSRSGGYLNRTRRLCPVGGELNQ